VDFLPDSDQDALIETTREYVESRFSLVDPSYPLEDVTWKEIAQLGWLGLATDEDAGGAGATLLDEVFVFREIGRRLVPGPILTTLAAGRLAAWTGDLAMANELVGGRSRVARALPVPAEEARVVLLDADDAPLTLVVDDTHAALHPTPPELKTHKGLEDQTTVSVVAREDLGPPRIVTHDAATVARLRRVLSILTSAQLAGITGATRDLATAYAKERVQFGKPIGAFQAIKHKCADMATNALAADNVTFFAALTELTAPTASDYNALAAAAFTQRAAFANARANVQIHGAMGFTVEDCAHRFVKRTHTLCVTEGFEKAAERLGVSPSAEASEEA
jgi:alkylation response protein AidB-like acyl-CoA dehydrogenase